ncbi:MAG: glycosyltransferase [Hyphomicrobiales bacterium]
MISAYACSPYKGSEPGVGWGFVLALSKLHDLWVIVEEEKFRADIELWQSKSPEEAKNIHFHFLRKKRNRKLRKIWPPSYYWFYRIWHQDALELAEKLHRAIDFDLVHQLTMVGYREPGYLWKMGIPFVWGPVGGMGYFPWRFLGQVGLYGGVYFLGYNTYNWLQERFLKRPKMAAQKAQSGLLLATSENKTIALHRWNIDGQVLAEVGVPKNIVDSPNSRLKNAQPFRLVWSGQHTPGKALNLALLALAQLPKSINWQLDILGSGRRTAAWKKMAEQLNIDEHCHFYGNLPRDKALNIMQNAHVMLITSLRDLTSTVTIEALSLGLPIICPNHCGFADAVTSECGIQISLITPKKFTTDFAQSIIDLEQNENLRFQLAIGAIERARKYNWNTKANYISNIYLTRLKENSQKDTL